MNKLVLLLQLCLKTQKVSIAPVEQIGRRRMKMKTYLEYFIKKRIYNDRQ